MKMIFLNCQSYSCIHVFKFLILCTISKFSAMKSRYNLFVFPTPYLLCSEDPNSIKSYETNDMFTCLCVL